MQSAARQQVQKRFKETPQPEQRDVWEELWKEKTTPWDQGIHNPALEDTLINRTGTLGAAVLSTGESGGQVTRKKALVPGCGRGVDVFLLASFGYDAYGLEYSATALETCQKEAEKYADGVPARDAKIGSGSFKFLQGDFFEDGWLESAGLENGSFDLVYDYTFFCALNPSLRPKWALRHSQLLSPSPRGNLICLEFPTFKDPKEGGPPFPSPSAAYMEHLSHPGEEISYDADGRVKSNPLQEASEKGLERVAHFQPERTHKIGTDENGNVLDWISIWRRRD